MVDIFLITGCLGSGKTTFLQNTLNNIQGKKIGVLINEFGQVGIDGDLVSKDNLQKIELNNGSIFCACLKDHFIQGLADLINEDLDYIFVESSGLSDPSNIYSIFGIVDTLTNKEYRYRGGICLVDSLYFTKQLDVLVNVKRQLEQCSLVLLNKVDLQTSENITSIKENILSINNNLVIEETTFGKLSVNRLDDFTTRDNVIDSDSLNREDNKPSVYTLDINPKTTKNNLENFVKGLMKSCNRIKGIIHLDEGVFKVDSVMDSFYIQPVENHNKKELVLMSSIGFKIIREINKLSKTYNISFKISC